MKWILFYLNENDNIVYISSLKPKNKEYIAYNKFLSFLFTHIVKEIKNEKDFEYAITRYKTILLYENGDWEIVENNSTNVYSHKDIALYNKDKVIIKQNVHQLSNSKKDYFLQNKINKSKNFIFNFRKGELIK